MNSPKSPNLKTMMLSLGDNQVVTATFLLKQGYSYENLKGYVKSGYMDSLGRGAYCRAGSHPSIEAAISAMAEQMAVPVHLGGRSALAKRGYVHFVPFTELPATVFMKRGVRLPAWFSRYYNGRFSLVKTGFLHDGLGVEQMDGCPVSSPERAFLEFLYGVPGKQSLAEAYQLLEMMLTLRPKLLNDLLVRCSSIKVKRLFFLLADDLNPPWWQEIKSDSIDLGSGCRVIDKGGSFNAKYNLVVKPWREI
ncbi:MAG: type IV toxin-antitoxin system AbiEi family antitoxin domain-containing protein [Kiritimatiellae bacterium]|nr:type IV toxin-antitoxin system AbiEi family antitoxin domain-containing protein [Kiritimatiellia bacterium]